MNRRPHVTDEAIHALIADNTVRRPEEPVLPEVAPLDWLAAQMTGVYLPGPPEQTVWQRLLWGFYVALAAVAVLACFAVLIIAGITQ